VTISGGSFIEIFHYMEKQDGMLGNIVYRCWYIRSVNIMLISDEPIITGGRVYQK